MPIAFCILAGFVAQPGERSMQNTALGKLQLGANFRRGGRLHHDAKQFDIVVGVFAGEHAKTGRLLRWKHKLELLTVRFKQAKL